MNPSPSLGLQARPFKHAAIVAAACAALCGWNAHAAGSTPSAADLERVKLYGNVTIAQDSAGKWGPWEQFEAPTAGPQTPLNLPNVREVYRPLSQPTGGATPTPQPAFDGCAASTICGWGIAASLNNVQVQDASVRAQAAVLNPEGAPAFEPVKIFDATGATYDPAQSTAGLPPKTLTLTIQPLTGVSPAFSSTGELTPSEANAYSRSSGLERVQLQAQTGSFEGFPDSTTTWAAPVIISLQRYLDSEQPEPIVEMQSIGVMGLVTSARDMADLRARNATASYVGIDYFGSKVTMDVNFGSSKFTASWNGGSDLGNVYSSSAADGSQRLSGRVGFNVAGAVSGSNFTSTSITANDGSIGAGSSVKGSFFGPHAIAAGGVADVTKTLTQQPNSDASSYTAARFVTPFIVVDKAAIAQPSRAIGPGTK